MVAGETGDLGSHQLLVAIAAKRDDFGKPLDASEPPSGDRQYWRELFIPPGSLFRLSRAGHPKEPPQSRCRNGSNAPQQSVRIEVG